VREKHEDMKQIACIALGGGLSYSYWTERFRQLGYTLSLHDGFVAVWE